jgi:hypothetical protein
MPRIDDAKYQAARLVEGGKDASAIRLLGNCIEILANRLSEVEAKLGVAVTSEQEWIDSQEYLRDGRS